MSFNRRSEAPLALHATSFKGQVLGFAHHLGAQAWPVVKHGQSLTEVFPADKVRGADGRSSAGRP